MKLYIRAVWKITRKQDLESLVNFDKRGRLDLNKKCLSLGP